MEREEFLKSFGLSLALICSGSCFSGCSKDKNEGLASGTKVSVDLATQLKTIGSQTSTNGILIFRIAEGNLSSSFVATQKLCPHENGNLNWIQADNKIVCDKHSAKFSTSGSVLSGPSVGGSVSPLKTYPVTIVGTTLTVTT